MPAGRPTKMTPQTVAKLEEAFSFGCTDIEACLYADIHKQTLYDYCEKYPEFTDRKETLKKHPTMVARKNLVRSINKGEVEDSKWYLERKSKAEFSSKQMVEHSGDSGNPVAIALKDCMNLTAGLPVDDKKV